MGAVDVTLAEWLKARADDQLAELLAARPDLTRPAPENLLDLAARASSPASARRAWDQLTALQRQVLSAVVICYQLGDSAESEVVAALDPERPDPVREALVRLRTLALVYDSGGLVVPTAGAILAVGRTPLGMALPEPARRVSPPLAPERIANCLAEAPAGARAALDRLAWGPPYGRVPNAQRAVTEESAATDVEWLLARELLVPDGPDTVMLPPEVAVQLRDGRLVQELAAQPPPPVEPGLTAPDADATGGMQAMAATRTTARLLAFLDRGGTRVLRNGGIYARDADLLAEHLGLGLTETSLLTDLAWSANLIGVDESAGLWRLTTLGDTWATLPEPKQWAVLVVAWRDTDRHAAMVGADSESDVRLLSDSLHVPGLADIRLAMLATAARTAAGEVLSPPAVTECIRWEEPDLDGPDLPALVARMLADAEFLGVTGRGALTSAGRALLAPEPTQVPVGEAVEWPRMVDRVVVQADLTATAMGPLTREAERRLAELADLESAGTASIFRFSGDSLQRAMDGGLSAAEISLAVGELSTTGIPITLETLIADVGRRHGAVRVLPAAAVVVSDDSAALATALTDRRVAHLGLQQIAPGVVVSRTASPTEVVTALREAGIPATSPETPRGVRRDRAPVPTPLSVSRPDADWIAAAVRSLRAGEASRHARVGSGTGVRAVPPGELVDLLGRAISDGRSLWLDYSDPTGTRRVRRVEPLTLRAGTLSGFDHREQRVMAYQLSRIAGVAPVADAG